LIVALVERMIPRGLLQPDVSGCTRVMVSMARCRLYLLAPSMPCWILNVITFSCTGVRFGGAVDALMGLAQSLRLPPQAKTKVLPVVTKSQKRKKFLAVRDVFRVASSASVVGSSAIVLSKWSASESSRQSDPGNKAEQAGALHNV
jgi:hypothetical protein